MASAIASSNAWFTQPQKPSMASTTTLLFLGMATSLLITPTAAQSFPYVPTEILMPDPTCVDGSVPCRASDIAYVFRQTASGKVEFRSLNFSSSVDADEVNLDYPAESTALPFLKGKSKSTAFGAARTANGSVLVYAGDCETGTGDVWSFDDDEGEWYRRGLENAGDTRRAPYFLGGTVAFSSSLAPEMDQPTLYTYGGMCARPTSGDDATDWQSNANYTKSMLRLAPEDKDDYTSYDMSVASSGGPRTPIAGFTLTGLTPSMTNKSGIVTQQASYVLLGGHTKTAFINMSTVAVWNLPAESWSYVNIQAPNGDLPKSDLAIKDTSAQARRRSTQNTAKNVYSRSGHTATLSEDGSSIVVIGGWVGDVNTPAEPQLAILEMSEIYSGWQWKIPDEQPNFSGIYGHGAAVLPGNMLMVYGGWESSTSSSRLFRRQASSGTLRFYNITSGSWGSSYTNPLSESSSSDDNNDDAPMDNGKGSNAKRLGLGLGLGFGIAALIGLIIGALCWYKKRKRHISDRDQAVRALSQDPNYYNSEYPEMGETDPWGLDSGTWYGGGADPYFAGERSLGYESMRGARSGMPGLHIPHKPMPRPSRGGYVPTGARPGSFPGPIHPIYEDDEEESYHNRGLYDHVLTPTSEVPSDPFQTPVTGTGPNNIPHPLCLTPGGGNRASATPSPEGPRHDPEVQGWVTEVDAAEGLLARMNSRRSQHHNSQNHDNAEGMPGRMNSRRSQNQGSIGHGQGRSSPTRHNSNRSAALRDDESRSGSNLSESARSAAESIKAKARQLNPLAPAFLAAGAEHPKPGSSSSDSYNTARSSFGALQAEGPSLLMGNQAHRYDDDEPSSPSKSKPRRGGWLGSLRRVFSGASTPTSSREDMSGVRRSFDQEPVSGDYEPGLVGLRGELLRRKKGRQDWEGVDDIRPGPVLSGGSGLEPGAESDWDIEKAVEQRLVQVMFTVPRERLRVVNGNEEGSDREDDVPMKPHTAELVDPDNESQASRGDSLRGKQTGHLYDNPVPRTVEEPRRDEDEVDQTIAEKQRLVQDEDEEQLKQEQRHENERQQFLDEKRAEEQRIVEEEARQTRLMEEEARQMQQREEDELKKREQQQAPPSQEQPASTLQQPKPSYLQPVHPLFQRHSPSPSTSPSPPPSPSPSPSRHRHSRRHTRDNSGNSVAGFLHHPDFSPLEPRFSHSTDDTGHRSSGVVMEAQAVPITRERARTRVLAMVNSFESLSRENSPSPSKFT
ncbi:uncharacterized protein QYS62_003834 [Fusarium acuminatum]|uniref:Galactose oxidase n=1 Tax=Fusarium acuminatum TaxID=5515 RepID=A0ABZ2WQ96_9HYPO